MELLIAIISSATALFAVWFQHFLARRKERVVRSKVDPIIKHANTKRFLIIIKQTKDFKFKSKSTATSGNSMVFENKDIIMEFEFDNLDLISQKDRTLLEEYSQIITQKIR